MEMSFLIILALAYAVSVARTKITDLEDVKNYLKQYGYIRNDSLTDFETVVMDFQERYNLFVDGKLNSETLHLMNRPRCVDGENTFTTRSKWNKTHLIWYFPHATEVYLKLAKKAFSFWEEESNLRFSYVVRPKPINPDITITFQSREHWFRANCQGNYKCPFAFDGPGVILAHAFYPEGNRCREIHIDSQESWYFGMEEGGDVPEGQSSLLMTLVHEIGHTLGLGHSGVSSAVMYPWYQDKITTLSSDDRIALEYLYGVVQKVPSSTIPSTLKPVMRTTSSGTSKPTTTSTTIRKIHSDSSNERHRMGNLCEIPHPDVMFLAFAPQFPNHQLYVIVKNLLWRLDVSNRKIPVEPEDVRDYLPKVLLKVTHVFQDETGNLLVADENRFYSVSFPDLNIQQDVELNLPKDSKVNAVFQTYTGKNYIWYNNVSFIEFSISDNQVINRGRVRDLFPGIPADISSVFRYMDGYLYFFRKNIYYKYNEFTRAVVEAGPFNWNIFGIACPDEELLDQLKTLLTKIIDLYE